MYCQPETTMICRGCTVDKDEGSFPMRKEYPKHKRRPYCYDCSNDIQRARYRNYQRNNPFKLKAVRAKSKATTSKVSCDVDAEYLESIWTGVCPVFGEVLDITAKRGESGATQLDRFIPELGYTKGNVSWLSARANNLKSSMSVEEISKLYNWMKSNESS